jgi:hypothetical protein
LNSPTNFKTLKILVADSHKPSCELICGYLKSWRCKFTFIDHIEDGIKALENSRLGDAPFKIVIVHHMPPYFNRQAFGHRIREDAGLNNINLIF